MLDPDGAFPHYGARFQAFAVLAGLFTRDLILSGQTCIALAGVGPAGPIMFEACVGRVQAAAGRPCWQVGALVVAGGSSVQHEKTR